MQTGFDDAFRKENDADCATAAGPEQEAGQGRHPSTLVDTVGRGRGAPPCQGASWPASSELRLLPRGPRRRRAEVDTQMRKKEACPRRPQGRQTAPTLDPDHKVPEGASVSSAPCCFTSTTTLTGSAADLKRFDHGGLGSAPTMASRRSWATARGATAPTVSRPILPRQTPDPASEARIRPRIASTAPTTTVAATAASRTQGGEWTRPRPGNHGHARHRRT